MDIPVLSFPGSTHGRRSCALLCTHSARHWGTRAARCRTSGTEPAPGRWVATSICPFSGGADGEGLDPMREGGGSISTLVSNHGVGGGGPSLLAGWLLCCSPRRLQWCGLTEGGCEALGTLLATHPSLACLELGDGALGDSGVRLLCTGLRQPGCHLRILR